MKHGSLFSGIGGFDLAAQWMGWQNVFHCEWEDFPRKVLEYHFPESESFGDITKTDFRKYANKIDILTGGFPCQPYSAAGKRKGKDDKRHLWPEMLRAIREIQPSWVVGENVYGLLNWSNGLVFYEVQTDLEAEGYEVWAYVLPASGVNAPHQRYRIWFVAYSDNTGTGKPLRTDGNGKAENEGLQRQPQPEFRADGGPTPNTSSSRLQANNNLPKSSKKVNSSRKISSRPTPDTEDIRHELSGISWDRRTGFENGNIKTFTDTERQRPSGKEHRQTEPGQHTETNPGQWWQNFPTQPPVRGGNDGLPDKLDNITFPKWRNESIKAYGNAIVPQVAFQIFKAIEQYKTDVR